jgi:hypothetical protein
MAVSGENRRHLLRYDAGRVIGSLPAIRPFVVSGNGDRELQAPTSVGVDEIGVSACRRLTN